MRSIWNFSAFQVGWFACVLGGSHHVPWLGVVAVATLIVLNANMAIRPGEELKLIGVTVLIGVTWDSLLVSAGWLVYPSGTLVTGTAPVWIAAIWAIFATTFNVSLRWVKERWLLASALGAVGGPFAFYAGARLGGVEFASPVVALTVLALGWAALMPLLMSFAHRFDGYEIEANFAQAVASRP